MTYLAPVAPSVPVLSRDPAPAILAVAEALPDRAPSAENEAWCEAHAISAGAIDLEAIKAAIARAHRLPSGR